MINDLMLHGSIGPVDYFVFVSGIKVSNTYFYEEGENRIRFFSRGNELTLTGEGLSYRGTGGNFCEYMFGVEKPFKDLIRREVLNRLVMFGAFLDKDERLVFTNDIEGAEPFHRLFLLGHAVKNYYFLISSEDRFEPKKRQRQILQSMGKLLKRNTLIAEDRDRDLLNSLVKELHEPRSTIFMFKLVHRENQKYHTAFKTYYDRERLLTESEESHLGEIALTSSIDSYQQERIKIDCLYRHPENKSIVDEYRDILLDITHKETIHQSELARLNRLKTLSIRNNIPGILFDTLDDFLLKGKAVEEIEEPEYLKESRAILENLFFRTASLKRHIISEDIARLIRAKHTAYSHGDMGFERLLLDIGKSCDEFAHEHNDYSIFEDLSSIITFFDRYDNVHALLSKIAFMEHHVLSEDALRSLVGNKKEFDQIDAGLYKEIFIQDLLINKYITAFGKKKISVLSEGVDKIIKGDASLKDIALSVQRVTKEERLYKHIRSILKEKMRELYTAADIQEEMNRIRTDLKNRLIKRGISAALSERLFDRVFLDLKKESYYVNQVLPVIVKKKDPALREDFLTNSGLDRFYIEAIEKEYLGEKGFSDMVEGKKRPDSGGGERI